MIDDATINYRSAELLSVCPFPVQDSKFFMIQIRSEDGRKTKYMNISAEEFKKIERILTGVPQ